MMPDLTASLCWRGACLLFMTAAISCANSPKKMSSTETAPMSTSSESDAPKPPVAKRSPKELIAHGQARVDPYFWMRDDDRKDPEILAHLEAENQYTEAVMRSTESLQERLFKEMVGRLKQDDNSAPYKDRGYWYYSRFEQGKEYPIYARKEGSLEAEEQLLLDANLAAEGHEYYNMGDYDLSHSGSLLAYSEDTVSRRIYTVRFKDVERDEMLPDVIEGTSGQVAWAADDRHLFYVKRDPETLRAYQVWRHALGTATDQDALVFEEKDEAFSVGVYRSRDREYMMLHSGSTLSDEVWTLPADEADGSFELFYPRERDHEYSVSHLDGKFYVRTNWEAKNFRLMAVEDARRTDREAWTEVIPHREDVYLSDTELFENYLAIQERVDGMTTIRLKPWKQGGGVKEHVVRFDDEAYFAYLSVNPDPKSEVVRLGYTSLTTPNSVYDYHVAQRELELVKRDEVLGEFDPKDYVASRVMAPARDGTMIPISIVHRRDLDRSTPAPLYQYGYGSYGASMEPYFGSARLSLLDRGFIFAIVHIRGGSEFGRRWYEEGKLAKKMNTFTDFIDASTFLIEQDYTTAERLVISGGSAGGLLVGAVMNMAPELYRAVVANVPFVDVVTTMLDETIPLTTFEYDEWGNPNEPDAYATMLAYSPYDNVKAQAYPNLLVLTGLHDSQVQYWEPMKWVAKLRELKTDDNLLLFRTDMEAGHGGASGRFERYREIALEYAFLLKVLGLEQVEPK